MSLGDYLLPWKAVPNMIRDVKGTFDDKKGKGRHDSFIGAIGKYADPIGALLGDNWMEFWHEKVPREVNRALEPVGEFHRDYLDPIWIAGGKNTDWGKSITDLGTSKGGDFSALIGGAVVGAGALGGAGAGGAGGGAGGAGGGGGSMFGQFGGFNPMSMMGQQQPPQGLIQPRRTYRYVPIQSVYPRGLV